MSSRKQKRAIAAWTKHARATSLQAARDLALVIVYGQSPGVQAYDLGIVLNQGETAWQRAPAYYTYRADQHWTVLHQGRRGRCSTVNEVHEACMLGAGLLDWLITNQRLAARQPDGTVLSIYWSAIEALTVDLTREIVILDAAGGFHGELAGPAIAPIAVAAIAACHGPCALLDHPALELLRAQQRAPDAMPKSVEIEAHGVRLRRSRT